MLAQSSHPHIVPMYIYWKTHIMKNKIDFSTLNVALILTLKLFFSCIYAIDNFKNKNYFIIIILELVLNNYLIILIIYSIKNKNDINVTTKTNLIIPSINLKMFSKIYIRNHFSFRCIVQMCRLVSQVPCPEYCHPPVPVCPLGGGRKEAPPGQGQNKYVPGPNSGFTSWWNPGKS